MPAFFQDVRLTQHVLVLLRHKLLYPLFLRSRVSGVSKDEADIVASWFSRRCEASSGDGACAPPHHEGCDTVRLMPRVGAAERRRRRLVQQQHQQAEAEIEDGQQEESIAIATHRGL